MSIKRYEKQFDYIDGSDVSRRTFTSPMMELGTPASPYSMSNLGAPLAHDKGTTNIVFEAYAIWDRNSAPYYWDFDHDWVVSEKLIEGTGFSTVNDLITHVYSTLKSTMSPSHPAGNFLLSEHPEVQSKRQGMWGGVNAGSFTHFGIRGSYSSYTFNPSTLEATVDINIEVLVFGTDTFNDKTGLWQNSTAARFAAIGMTGKFDEPSNILAISALASMLSKTRYSMCAPCGVTPVTGGITFTDTIARSYVGHIFCITGDQTVFAANNMPNALATPTFAVGQFGLWNQDGDVDPTPPEPPGPDDPYPPPKPGPDDPPDPVDPVDPVPEPDDPALDGTNCGIYSVYNPSRSALRQLGAKLWDPNVWDIIKQYFTAPMEALLSLSIIPVTPSTSSPEAIVIGNYNSRVGAPVVNSDYVTFNCGSVYIPRFFGSYLDYDPYTTYKLYLPFIGEVDLNADEITAETITIKYKVNVVSGDCVALCMKNNNVFAEFNGNCARFLPLSQASWSSFVQAAASFASAAIVGGVSLAGSGATGEAIESSIGASKNGQIRAAANVAQQQSIGANIASSGINAVVGSKMSYNKAGRLGQSAGQISVRTPYITITRPNLTLPENIDQASSSALRNYIGYPTNRIGRLSAFRGLTVVEACQLSSQHATEEELAEALEIMKGGVIL